MGVSQQRWTDAGLDAKVAELVDALVLGTSGATRESSSLSFRTISEPLLDTATCHCCYFTAQTRFNKVATIVSGFRRVDNERLI